MLTIRPNSLVNPTALEFENAQDVDQDLQEAIGKQTWPVSEYKQLLSKLDDIYEKELCEEDDIDMFPLELLALCRSIKVQDVKEKDLEEKIGSHLWNKIASPYQRDGVKFMVARNGRGLLADKMGLGKTLQAILFLLFYRQKWPAVVVCPAFPKLTWQLEFKQFLQIPYFPNCTPNVSRIITDYLDPILLLKEGKQIAKIKNKPKPWITIISYDLLRNEDVLNYLLQKVKPQVMVIDESHFIKHEKAQRSRVTRKLADSCKHVLLMSGTPLNRCQDLFGQLHCLYPKFFPRFFYKSYREYCEVKKKYKKCPHRKPFYFAEYFCAGTFRQQRLRMGGQQIWVPQTGGISRAVLLHAILSQHILIQRTPEQVLADELAPIERMRYVMANPIATAEADAKKAKEEGLKHEDDKKQLKYFLFQQYHELAKVKALLTPTFMDYYLKLHEGKPPKTLVWAHHHEVMNAAQTWCEDHKLGFIRIDGTVPDKERVKLVELFKKEERIPFALLSLTACNTGLNLQISKENVFLQLIWDVFQTLQAEKRNHRRGQTEQVTSRFALAENSLDKLLWKINSAAYRNAALVTQGTEESFLAEYKKFLHNDDDYDNP